MRTLLHGLSTRQRVTQPARFTQLAMQHGQLRASRARLKARSSNARSTGPFIGFRCTEGPGLIRSNRALFAALPVMTMRNIQQFLAKLLQKVAHSWAGQFDVRDERVG